MQSQPEATAADAAAIEAHLTSIMPICGMPPDHAAYLWRLKRGGFEPKVIYDIGACVRQWTDLAKTIWPDAVFVLFDAFDKAAFLYAGYPHHLGVLSDEDGKTVNFFENPYFPAGNSYYRELPLPSGEQVFPPDRYRVCRTSKLDTVVAAKGFPAPDFVKIDVQGSEMDVIRGGMRTLSSAQHLIVELQHSQYNERAPLADASWPEIEQLLGVRCVAPLFCNNGSDGDYGFAK